MRKILSYLTLLLVATLVANPLPLLADDVPPEAPANLSAVLSGSELRISFTESPATDLKGYLLLRKEGVTNETPTLLPKIAPTILNIPSDWSLAVNTAKNGGNIGVEQNTYTYLLYQYDHSYNYSTPSRIVVSYTDQNVSSDLAANLLVLSNGKLAIQANRTLTIAKGGSFAWLGGSLSNQGIIDVKGVFRVPAGITYDNGNGLFQVSAEGKTVVEGEFNIVDRPNNTIRILEKGLLHVAPIGKLTVFKHGDLRVDSKAIFTVDGTLDVLDEVRANFYIKDDAITTFGPGAFFHLRKNLKIPKATWLDGSTMAWYYNGMPTGIKQLFSNFIWDVSDQGGPLNLNCDLKPNGKLIVQNTNSKLLTLGSCDYTLGGDLVIGTNAMVSFDDKLTSTTGSINNNGSLTVVNELKVRGSLENKAGAAMLLPKKTTTGGNMINFGEISPYSSSDYDLLDIGGRLENNSRNKFALPKVVKVKGDLINRGTLVPNAELYLEGSLENQGEASFKSAVSWSKIHFTNTSQLNKASRLRIPEANLANSAIGEILIENGRSISLASDLELAGNAAKSGKLQVKGGATLNLGTYEVRNALNATNNDFILEDGASLEIGHAQGIAPASEQAGAIRTTTRNYGAKAFYTYAGTSPQITGYGLPAKMEGSLTIDNPSAVTLTQHTTVTKLLRLNQGEFNLNHKVLTLNGQMTQGFGTLKGSNQSELLVVNDDENATITIPAVTLKQLYIKVKKKVDLSGSVTIHDKLDMEKGILYTHSNRVKLLPTATLTEDEDEADEGFVIGMVETEHITNEINKVYAFSNIGLEITYNGTPAGTTQLVRYTGSTTPTEKDLVVNRAFQIKTTVGEGLDAKLVFKYMKHEIKALLLNFEDKFNLLRSEDGGTNYRLVKGSVANKDARTVTLSNINSFTGATTASSTQSLPPGSSTILGSATAATHNTPAVSGFEGISRVQQAVTTQSSTWTAGDPTINPFPVELASFTAKLTAAGEVQLYWTTASEADNSHFEVERSADGRQFRQVVRVAGAGNSNTTKAYSYTDKEADQLTAPVVYYRLKQVDFKGTHAFSKVIAVQQQERATGIRRISINPGTGNLEVHYANLAPGLPMHVVLADLKGRLLVNAPYKLDAPTGTLVIPLNSSAKGIMAAKVASGELFLAAKVIR
ncbi:hypothetical protein ACXYMU_07935 [Pontibacter sp. CAU 1760]